MKKNKKKKQGLFIFHIFDRPNVHVVSFINQSQKRSEVAAN